MFVCGDVPEAVSNSIHNLFSFLQLWVLKIDKLIQHARSTSLSEHEGWCWTRKCYRSSPLTRWNHCESDVPSNKQSDHQRNHLKQLVVTCIYSPGGPLVVVVIITAAKEEVSWWYGAIKSSWLGFIKPSTPSFSQEKTLSLWQAFYALLLFDSTANPQIFVFVSANCAYSH